MEHFALIKTKKKEQKSGLDWLDWVYWVVYWLYATYSSVRDRYQKRDFEKYFFYTLKIYVCIVLLIYCPFVEIKGGYIEFIGWKLFLVARDIFKCPW